MDINHKVEDMTTLNSLPTHQNNENIVNNNSNTIENKVSLNHFDEAMDDDSVRLVVLGEASMLSTAILKSTQRSTASLSRSTNTSQSRLSTLVAEYEEEDDVEDLISDPLLKSLIGLKGKLRKDKLVVTDPNYLRPFCEVIKNKDVSGPVTGLALQSILKFINYGLIKNESAVQMISDSVTKARFIGTDTSSDEVVLMRILNVLRELIVRRYESLTNGAVCEIMQSCFRIAFEPRLSELLRKSAEQSLVDMVQVLFRRIPEFNHEFVDELCFIKMGSKMNTSLTKRAKHNTKSDFANKQSIKFNKDDHSRPEKSANYYGLACIHELLSYLTSLINPLPEGQNTEAMINVGLTLLTVTFETSVHGIGSKQCLITTVKTDLCWNLMQLLQSDRPLNSFAASLRLAFLIFTNLRMHLKYQFEALLIRLMDIITTGNAPFEFREIASEYLVAFFRHLTHLPHEIYFNYDCDPYASNLLEDLLQLFSKNCFTTSLNNQQMAMSSASIFTFTSMQMLSLDALLANLKSLQKAELCHDNVLMVCPATTVVNITSTKPVVERASDQTMIPSTDDSIEISPSLECVQQKQDNDYDMSSNILPEDVDIGSIRGEQMNAFIELPSPTSETNETVDTNRNQNEIKDTSDCELPAIDSMRQRCYVSYKFPKVCKVPKNTVEIINEKERKLMLSTATEQFNSKPAKGIQFLTENKLISSDMDIVCFLRDNPKLDKKQIGEYLSNKKNLKVLQAFVESFAFKDIRIDEALRLYLESFRLPGEAPLISMVLEHFAHHWHESNGCPFVNEDAAFSLAYAIIMLNVDQHNTNVKRQTNPMTCEEFISNLRQVNGGKDFDSDMLKEIYFVIKNNEIIMPAEQQGLIRERYLWKCLLRNSQTENGVYWFLKNNSNHVFNQLNINSIEENQFQDIHMKLSSLNGPIFSVLWGPTVAAMTFIFDKINPEQQSGLTRRILNNGFNSCALLCATYGHLDNLIVSLSKFIMNSSSVASPLITNKSELAAQCLFGITRDYANEMRDSWNNIIELILNWYNSKLLNDTFEIEDFALESKKIRFRRRENQKQNIKNVNDSSSILSSFYSYFAGNQQQNDVNDFNENNDPNSYDPIPQETSSSLEVNSQTRPVVNNYCQPLLLIIEESKFLHIDSLLELIKALINVQLNNEEFDDDIEVFKLEILLRIILMNRDRVTVFWDQISGHILRLFILCPKSEYLTERVMSTIFRLAIRFTPRPDSLSEQIFLLLCHMMFTFEPNMIQRQSTAIALHSFVSQCNCYITRSEDWSLIFNLLLSIGIGFQRRSSKNAISTETEGNVNFQSDNEDNSYENVSNPSISRGYTSDSELDVTKTVNSNHNLSNNSFRFLTDENNSLNVNSAPIYRILDLNAYEKSTEILTLIIREVLPNNAKNVTQSQSHSGDSFHSVAQLAVDALQKFVEASIKIQLSLGKTGQLRRTISHKYRDSRKHHTKSRSHAVSNKSRLSRIANAILSSSESEDEDTNAEKDVYRNSQPKLSSVTETCALRLLDLMHYFHLNAALTVENNGSDFLWSALWCPLLQGIAMFCCDSRRPVRTCALTFLQRALLLHDLRILSASQWENCFNKVLFPLLSKLLEPINMCDPIGMDETRMRTTNLLCKVFLQHLTPLLTLPTFTALWLTILDFMDKYIKADMQTDLVKEAIPESLKNILLVMDTAGCFNDTLAAITWDRIAIFLPNLHQEIIPPKINTNSDDNQQTIIENCRTIEEKSIQTLAIDPQPEQVSHSFISSINQNNAQQKPSFASQVSFDRSAVMSSTCIDMEDCTKMPSNQFNPMVLYPGSIAPFVPMTNVIQKDMVYAPNVQMSAYPWPQPSSHKS